MALNLQYDTKEAIPAGAAEHYTETDAGEGKKVWMLQGSGFVSATKHQEFRDSNTALLKYKTETETKFKDVDPAEYVKLKGRAELFNEGKLIEADKLEAKFSERLAPIKTEYEGKLTTIEQRAKTAEEKVAKFTIDKAALDAAIVIGIAKGAQTDIVARVRGVFSMGADGNLIAIRPETGKEWYGSNGEMITPADYVKLLAAGEGAHLFAGNNGGGAGGAGSGTGGGGGTGGGVNPWDPTKFDLTAQMAEFRKDPDNARRMAAKFGKTIGVAT